MSAALPRCLLGAVVQTQAHFLGRATSVRTYAKKIVSKVSAQSSQKFKSEVEQDPEKLLKYCCGANIYVEGSDPEIKPDSEYPEWLWNLRLERRGVELSELDPNTLEFWKRYFVITRDRNIRIKKRLQKLREFQFPVEKK